jgi:hypothetical protein
VARVRPSKREALSSNPITAQKKKKRVPGGARRGCKGANVTGRWTGWVRSPSQVLLNTGDMVLQWLYDREAGTEHLEGKADMT